MPWWYSHWLRTQAGSSAGINHFFYFLSAHQWVSSPWGGRYCASGLETRKRTHEKRGAEDHWLWFFDSCWKLQNFAYSLGHTPLHALLKTNRPELRCRFAVWRLFARSDHVLGHHQDASLRQSEGHQDSEIVCGGAEIEQHCQAEAICQLLASASGAFWTGDENVRQDS